MDNKNRISETLKQTLQDPGKFATFSLTVSLFERCVETLLKYGISSEAVSCLKSGLEKISDELKEGYEYVKVNEEFASIVRSLRKSP